METSETNIKFILTTAEFAKKNLVVEQSVRARLSKTGSYFGVIPLKLANGRTVWPDMHVV
ncbi:MAG: hypothetical protein WBJ84_11115 [Bacteroidales bacterium]